MRNSWVPVNYGTTNPDLQPNAIDPWWQEAYSYDALSRKLSKDNTRASYAYPDQDWRYAYDGLDRLTGAQRGLTGSAGFSPTVGSKAFTLDELGNWTSVQRTEAAGTVTEQRAHTATNQIASIGDVNATPLYRFYDPNGNMVLVTEDAAAVAPASERQRLTFDAWNRLVRAQKLGVSGWQDVTFAYNGLNWKVRERRSIENGSVMAGTDMELAIQQSGNGSSDGAGGVQGLQVLGDPGSSGGTNAEVLRWAFYSPAWQLLLEVKGHPGNVLISQEQQFWGQRDDALLRRIDGDGDNNYESSSSDAEFFQLTDSSLSVVAHVDLNNGTVRQWMSYDSYGQVTTLRLGDFNGDGVVGTGANGDDLAAFNAAVAAHATDPTDLRADVSGDGVVDGQAGGVDRTMFEGAYYAPADPDEARIGYGGYVRDPLTGYLLARNRWYEPPAGRWVTRDPAGYVDGLSLYLYVKGDPISLVDPTGLWGLEDAMNWVNQQSTKLVTSNNVFARGVGYAGSMAASMAIGGASGGKNLLISALT